MWLMTLMSRCTHTWTVHKLLSAGNNPNGLLAKLWNQIDWDSQELAYREIGVSQQQWPQNLHWGKFGHGKNMVKWKFPHTHRQWQTSCILLHQHIGGSTGVAPSLSQAQRMVKGRQALISRLKKWHDQDDNTSTSNTFWETKQRLHGTMFLTYGWPEGGMTIKHRSGLQSNNLVTDGHQNWSLNVGICGNTAMVPSTNWNRQDNRSWRVKWMYKSGGNMHLGPKPYQEMQCIFFNTTGTTTQPSSILWPSCNGWDW